MRYENAGQFDRAAKKSIRESGKDPGVAYREMLRDRFLCRIFSGEEKDPVLIDLSLDCSTTQPVERITPANRIEIEGVVTSDYLAYPLADKLCAIMGMQPGGWTSSRMKDLVDVVAYATHERFALGQLARAIRSECAKRGMEIPEDFSTPGSYRPA